MEIETGESITNFEFWTAFRKHFQQKNCQAKRSKNREGTSGNIINSYISDWYMCLLPWTKRKFISEKKRDPLITFLTRFLVAETMNSRRENSKLRIVVCRYRLSPLCIEPFFQRNIGAKRRKVASPIFDAFGKRRRSAIRRREGEEEARKTNAWLIRNLCE